MKSTPGDGKKRGKQGDRNDMRHGLACGKVPPECKYIELRSNVFRRNLEDAVLSVRDEISLTDAAHVATATAWVRHAMLASRWLRMKESTLSPDQLLRFSETIAKASERRDAAIRHLKLTKAKQDDVIATLYRKDNA